MSRWFRHYAGMMRDEKLVRVAIKSKQPVERVLWVWGAILESAAEINDNGRYDFDPAEAAYFLRADEADVVAVATALADAGRLDQGCVVKWGDRQFQSDSAAERQRRYRERKRGSHSDGQHRNGEGDTSEGVTSRERNGHATVTVQETETETETELEPTGSCAPDGAPAIETVAKAWNAMADKSGVPKVQKLTAARRSRFKVRAREYPNMADWEKAIDAVAGNAWLCGRNDREWKADFDFLLQAKSFTKLVEQSYGKPGKKRRDEVVIGM